MLHSKSQSTLVLIGEEHSGRDEMNLAGNPFALLQAASRAGQSLIQYEYDRQLPNGKIVKASWEVNGHTELGLPGPNEELLYLVLLQLTREIARHGEWPRLVPFSRFDVLKRMGWSHDARTYRTLEDCFKRLASVTISARHSFWNARAKATYEAVSFGLLEAFGIVAEPPGRKGQNTLPLSWFRWSETLHESFLAGNVRSLALDFMLSLDIPTARRLFRFLDMMRNAHKPPRREFEIGVMKLRDRLGMAPYAYPSKIREKLVSGIEELISRGYLSSVDYRKGNDGEIAIFKFGDVALRIDAPPTDTPATSKQVAKAPKPPVLKPSQPDDAIYPREAFAVWESLPEAEQERLRQLARAEVEPVFWDRLERPDSPMALVLWEIVAQQHADLYQKQLESG